jgi:hypothetical protein
MTLRSSLFPVEALERRSLLSAATLTDGLLQVTGDQAVTNQITVGLSVDGNSVEVSMATNDMSRRPARSF